MPFHNLFGNIDDMTPYHQEQFEAQEIIRQYLASVSAAQRDRLRFQIEPYLSFRQRLDDFLGRYFNHVCSRSCFTDGRSACCSREGIITFFADAVVNALCAEPGNIDRIMDRLQRPNDGPKCVYLTEAGCMWAVRPIVCAMFLCDPAQETVFEADASLVARWEAFKEEKKRFTWPDRPVLFDDLEAHFIAAGFRSSLMYLHFSPGLLRVKRMNPPGPVEKTDHTACPHNVPKNELR